MSRPINDKCVECSKQSFRGDISKPECWAGKACMKKRSYYRKHEHYKKLLRDNHSYLKYKGDKCVICYTMDALEVHHIIPQCIGGRDIEENTITLCKEHHRIITTYHKIIGYI